jgi:dephospho-CoA kinase
LPLAEGGTVPAVPPFVALTGGIGAGKSTALGVLQRLGAAVISTDAVVHELYRSPAVRDAVVERFGSEVLRVNRDDAPQGEIDRGAGEIDRGALAERAFATDHDRAWLEQLLWPRVRERVDAWREESGRIDPAPRALVVEVPLLFEAGGEAMYDATIAVIADEKARDARAQARGHRALDERAARQLSQEEKAARSTFVVVNDGDVEQLEHKLSAVLDMLGV